MPTLFEYAPHPHIHNRHAAGPTLTVDQVRLDHPNPFVRINARLGLAITNVVGTMWAAYAFTLIAFMSLPAILSTFRVFHSTFPSWMIKASLIALIAWISSNFLQLVLLPIIIVGQNIQARAADKRAEDTYHDADAVLHEVTHIQMHLKAQDEQILLILEHLNRLQGGPAPA
jgi:hypothetical protein